MVKHEVGVTSHDWQVRSYNLHVKTLKARVGIQKYEFKSTN